MEYKERLTPEYISELAPKEIFVFGSNAQGMHMGGAARVARFITFVRQHPELTFLVTPIGCSIAGYRPEQIAPMFADAAPLSNVFLPMSFWKILTDNK